MKMRGPVYPFLFAVAPVLGLYGVNRAEVGLLDLVRPCVVGLFVAAGSYAAVGLLARTRQARGVLSCIPLVAVLAYGTAFFASAGFMRQRVFLPLWIAATFVACVGAARLLRNRPALLSRLNSGLTVFGFALTAMLTIPLLIPGKASPDGDGRWDRGGEVESWLRDVAARGTARSGSGGESRPDVYYILLDGYARGDVLKSRFDYDNGEFLEWLNSRGFFVAERAHANYCWTHLSLAATLNGAYLQDLVGEEGGGEAPREYRKRYQYYVSKLGPYILESRVRRFFDGMGYRTVVLESGSAVTRRRDKSVRERLFGPPIDFEDMLLDETLVGPCVRAISRQFGGRRAPCGAKYNAVVRMLQRLAALADENGPKFVFAHVMAPHDPFCFDEKGGTKTRDPVYDRSPWVEDQRVSAGWSDWYRTWYPKNVAGLNVHVRVALQRILDCTRGEAVIIVQADHGSHLGLDPRSVDGSDLAERFGILSAIYIPAWCDRSGLYPGMSSVNTFRFILSNVFGERL